MWEIIFIYRTLPVFGFLVSPVKVNLNTVRVCPFTQKVLRSIITAYFSGWTNDVISRHENKMSHRHITSSRKRLLTSFVYLRFMKHYKKLFPPTITLLRLNLLIIGFRKLIKSKLVLNTNTKSKLCFCTRLATFQLSINKWWIAQMSRFCVIAVPI